MQGGEDGFEGHGGFLCKTQDLSARCFSETRVAAILLEEFRDRRATRHAGMCATALRPPQKSGADPRACAALTEHRSGRDQATVRAIAPAGTSAGTTGAMAVAGAGRR